MTITIKPAAIIAIIWATVILFSDLTVLYDGWDFIMKIIAVGVLLYLSTLEFKGNLPFKRDEL
jgi:hypothetical protein